MCQYLVTVYNAPMTMDAHYKAILDDDVIEVVAYNCETILAEKYETIIRRNIGTSRARDFYDLHMFYHMYANKIDFKILEEAIHRTARKRSSEEELKDWKEICEDMKVDEPLRNLWRNYQNSNRYASSVDYDSTLATVEEISIKTNM